jgi:hypothetical protein
VAVDDGLIGAMSQTTQHAIALVWGAFIGAWRDRLAAQGARSTEATTLSDGCRRRWVLRRGSQGRFEYREHLGGLERASCVAGV